MKTLQQKNNCIRQDNGEYQRPKNKPKTKTQLIGQRDRKQVTVLSSTDALKEPQFFPYEHT